MPKRMTYAHTNSTMCPSQMSSITWQKSIRLVKMTHGVHLMTSMSAKLTLRCRPLYQQQIAFNVLNRHQRVDGKRSITKRQTHLL